MASPKPDRSDLRHVVEQAVLGFYAPAFLVLTADLHIVERGGDLTQFGFPPAFAILPSGRLGAAIGRLVGAGSRAQTTLEGVRIILLPLASRGGPLYCVLLEPVEGGAAERVRELEAQLSSSQGYLTTVLRDYEAATEELRSAYEELKCANGELLHANHELSSANEDLNRLNESLERKTRELNRAYADLSCLLSSASIPLVMVGQDLRVRMFSSPAARFFNLSEGDIGRPIRDVRPTIDLPHLEAACMEVLETVTPWSRQVQDRDGRQFSVLVRPYRTPTNHITGVVLSVVEAVPQTTLRV